MPYFYGGCIGSSIWMGSGLECGTAAMDNVVSCLGFFLFCSFSHGIAFLILLYPWESATELVCAWISLYIALLHSVRIKRILCVREYGCSISVYRELCEVLTCGSILSCSCCLMVSADVYMWRTFSLYGGLLLPPCLLHVYFICVKIHCIFSCPVTCVARHYKHYVCLPNL